MPDDKQLLLRYTPEFIQATKVAAYAQGKTMKQFIAEAVSEKMKKEEPHDDDQAD